MSKRERIEKLGDQAKKFKNFFIKNFGEALDSQKLTEIFSKHGEITSVVVMSDDTGKSKGFGFVAFENHEAAESVSFLFCFKIHFNDPALDLTCLVMLLHGTFYKDVSKST